MKGPRCCCGSRGISAAVPRHDGREPDDLRPVKIELGVNVHAEGSCLIEMGRTRVWITATVEDRVPPHRRGTGHGWVTAEYSMLPRSTHTIPRSSAFSSFVAGLKARYATHFDYLPSA